MTLGFACRTVSEELSKWPLPSNNCSSPGTERELSLFPREMRRVCLSNILQFLIIVSMLLVTKHHGATALLNHHPRASLDCFTSLAKHPRLELSTKPLQRAQVSLHNSTWEFQGLCYS